MHNQVQAFWLLALLLQSLSLTALAGGHLAISEIGLRERGRWIELTNYGKESVPVAGCVLRVGEQELPLDTFVENVPAKGIVLVSLVYDQSTLPVHDARPPLFVRWPFEERAIQKFFGRTHGECALLRRSALIDFVCWGEDPPLGSASYQEAVKTRIWSPGGFVHVWERKELQEIRWGPSRPLDAVASIARLEISSSRRSDDWFVCRGNEVTPGTANGWPRPLCLSPVPGQLLTTDGPVNFAWFGVAAVYELQISRGAEFQDLVVQKQVRGKSLALGPGMLPGEYVFRVRVYQLEKTSPWSEAAHFEIRDQGVPNN